MKEDLKEMERRIRVLITEFREKHNGSEVSATISPIYISEGVFDRFIGHKIDLVIQINNKD